ncbi:transmembrane protein [Paraphysoderma sedebokerense]|nr:transmembrane protein [Paraphysoderma sedebokerense]
MPTLYTRPFALRYRTNCCSQSGILIVLVAASTIVISFVIAYTAGVDGFYAKSSSYYEQPSITYTHSYFLQLSGTQSARPNDLNIPSEEWSTGYMNSAGWVNMNLNGGDGAQELRVPVVKSIEVDENRDGKFDYLDLELTVPMADDEMINRFRLMLEFKVRLMKGVPLTVRSLSIIDIESSSSLWKANLNGELNLIQNELIAYSNRHQNMLEGSVLNTTRVGERETKMHSDEWKWERILEEYQRRNVRTVVTYPPPTLMHPRSRAQPFTFTLRLTYPAQLIRYVPSLQETLLKAWIQYFAVAWLIGTITHRLVVFAVKYHLIRTEMAVDRVPTADLKRTNGDFGRFKMGFL